MAGHGQETDRRAIRGRRRLSPSLSVVRIYICTCFVLLYTHILQCLKLLTVYHTYMASVSPDLVQYHALS
jgi:hypothetical protein